MNPLTPLEVLYDGASGNGMPLPDSLAGIYGTLAFPARPGSPYIISNFVSSIDGVAALDTKGSLTGDVISGSNAHDSCVMGILRAASDAVIVGAGTLAASPSHLWTPEYIYPPQASAFRKMRDALGKQEPMLNVIVTDRGTIDPSIPLIQSGSVQVLIVTTRTGVSRLSKMDLPAWVRVVAGDNAKLLTARQIIEAVVSVRPSVSMILVEGGPHLVGYFFAEQMLDELFLTLSPQIAGRVGNEERMGIVADQLFAPAHPLWGSIVSVRKAADHLFLRYAFASNVNVFT
ncbi:MAG TPA: dihydrofolate reductase family protein [Bacteroidota bacterium]|nr:dihydrofolate reductase family protein [Bacteroidota bacterium]